MFSQVGPVGIEPTTRGLKEGIRSKAWSGVRCNIGRFTCNYADFLGQRVAWVKARYGRSR